MLKSGLTGMSSNVWSLKMSDERARGYLLMGEIKEFDSRWCAIFPVEAAKRIQKLENELRKMKDVLLLMTSHDPIGGKADTSPVLRRKGG